MFRDSLALEIGSSNRDGRSALSQLGSILAALIAIAVLVAGASGCRTAQEPAAAEAEAPIPPGIETFPLEVVTATSLNVRAGPGTEHGIVGRLAQGAQVRVLEQMDGWKRIRPDEGGLEGWVAGGFLQATSNP